REIDRRRHVGVNGEGRRDRLLGREQPGQVAVDLTHQTVRAGGGDAIAVRWRRLGSDEMVALLYGEDKERVALVDAGRGQPSEELAEGFIVILQLLDVIRLPRTPGRVDFARNPVLIMGVRDIAEGHCNSLLLHLRDICERRACEQTVEARKPGLSE